LTIAFLVFPRVLDAYKLRRIEKMFEMTEACTEQIKSVTSARREEEVVGGREGG
jgi:hypothetical protein